MLGTWAGAWSQSTLWDLDLCPGNSEETWVSFKKPGRFVVIVVAYRAHFSCRGESGPEGTQL